jgi:hypothetical protein
MVGGSHRVRLKETLSILMLVGLMLLAGFFIYHKYLEYHLRSPEGCDEFGYLNMAKAIDEGELFRDHAKRPFLPELISHLRREFPDENSYRWMIAPHAYHLGKYRGQVYTFDKVVFYDRKGKGFWYKRVRGDTSKLAISDEVRSG